MRRGADIRALFDEQFTPEAVAGECAYFAAPTARGFKRPYGWAWLLEARRRADALGRVVAGRTRSRRSPTFIARTLSRDFLPIATYPVRLGRAFQHRLRACGWRRTTPAPAADRALAAELIDAARRWYGDDADCPAWGEPGGDDFLSPTP